MHGGNGGWGRGRTGAKAGHVCTGMCTAASQPAACLLIRPGPCRVPRPAGHGEQLFLDDQRDRGSAGGDEQVDWGLLRRQLHRQRAELGASSGQRPRGRRGRRSCTGHTQLLTAALRQSLFVAVQKHSPVGYKYLVCISLCHLPSFLCQGLPRPGLCWHCQPQQCGWFVGTTRVRPPDPKFCNTL